MVPFDRTSALSLVAGLVHEGVQPLPAACHAKSEYDRTEKWVLQS